MRQEKKNARMREIEAVAYKLLAERGYDGTSMLEVAKAARASNETLYRWYGDKNGLFLSMVRANAGAVREELNALIAAGTPPLETLDRIAPVLLSMLLGDRAIALNRAAAADATGALGQAIVAGGREEILPLIKSLIKRAIADRALGLPKEGQIGPLFMHLLVGDQQIRRAIGAIPAPEPGDVTARAADAMAQFRRLCDPAQE